MWFLTLYVVVESLVFAFDMVIRQVGIICHL